jgi:hypothetical protein
MWPIQLVFRFLISCRIFLCSLTLSNTSSFFTWSVQLISSILLQHHISKLSRCFWFAARSVRVSAPYKAIGHILRRNCLLKQVIEGKIKGEIEVTRRRGRRHKKLLDDLKGRRGYSHLKEEALDRTMWRNHFAGGFGPVVRQNTEWKWTRIIPERN